MCLKEHKTCPFPIHYSDILAQKTESKIERDIPKELEAISQAVTMAGQFKVEISNILGIVDSKLDLLSTVPEDFGETPTEIHMLKRAINLITAISTREKVFDEISITFGKLKEFIKKRKKEICNSFKMIGCHSCLSCLATNSDFATISDWIGGNSKEYKLLFRASRDGFKASDFHSLCDNIAPNLLIVKTNKDRIIGGYSVNAWTKGSEYEYKEDMALQCFLFSLTKQEKYNLKAKEYATCSSSDHGPKYGGGHDLEIQSNCNTVENQYSGIGFSYAYTGGNSADFYGAAKFLVEDYEVFQVSDLS